MHSGFGQFRSSAASRITAANQRFDAARETKNLDGTVRHKCFVSYHSADVEGAANFVEAYEKVFIPRAIGVEEPDCVLSTDSFFGVFNKLRPVALRGDAGGTRSNESEVLRCNGVCSRERPMLSELQPRVTGRCDCTKKPEYIHIPEGNRATKSGKDAHSGGDGHCRSPRIRALAVILRLAAIPFPLVAYPTYQIGQLALADRGGSELAHGCSNLSRALGA